jgi:hypothetical protein
LRQAEESRGTAETPTRPAVDDAAVVATAPVEAFQSRSASQGGLYHVVHSLQRLIGNAATGRVLAAQDQRVPATAIGRGPELAEPRQTGLTVAPAGDPSERQAARMAADAARHFQQPAQRAESHPIRPRRLLSPARISALAPAESVGRTAARSRMGAEGGPLDAPTDAAILRARGRGDRLDSTTRQSFEAVFGVDFSAVRIHDDAAADALSDELNAHAFTTGSDIFFGRHGYAPTTPSGRQLLAHELSHVAQHRAATSGQGPVIHRDYAGLTAMGKKRVDQEIEETYQTKALQFEVGMARKIETNAAVNTLVDGLVASVKQIVDAWAVHTRRAVADTYLREFGFPGGDAYYGAFEVTAANISEVLATPGSKPLRTKLKLIYNAVRNNNLTKWLKLAAVELDLASRPGNAPRTWNIRTETQFVERNPGQPAFLRVETADEEVTPGFAASSGLQALFSASQVTGIAAAHARERQTVGTGGATPRDVFDQRNFGVVLGWKPETVKANRERRAGATQGLTLDQQRTLTVADVPNLTDPELDLILKQLGNPSPTAGHRLAYRGAGARRVPWSQGGEHYDIMLGSDSARVADQIKGRLEAGISGSTDLMLHAFEYLGITPGSNEAKALRLGLAAWMIANRDHSFYEVYKAAVPYGLPFNVDPAHPGAEYEDAENLRPMQKTDFAGILPDDPPLHNVFPADYFSEPYKDHVANALPAPGDTQAQIHTALQAIDLSTALSTMNERDTAALQKLDALVQAQPIHPADAAELRSYAVRQIRLHPAFIHLGNVYGQDRAEAILNVLLRRHHAGKGVSKDDLRTQLADAGVPRSILDHVDDAEVGRIDAVRQAIVSAPVLAFTATDMAPIDAATGLVGLDERDTIKWNLITKLRPAWLVGTDEQMLADTLERRAQLEQIADMERTTGVWYSWGNESVLQGYIAAPSLRQATRTVNTSTQGPGLYIGRNVTTSASNGNEPGKRCLVVKMDNVPTINVGNAAQMAKLGMLRPRGPSADPLEAALVYHPSVSVEILVIYDGGDFGRLTTNKGVALTMDLGHAPVDHLRSQWKDKGKWTGKSGENFKIQAAAHGIDVSAW